MYLSGSLKPNQKLTVVWVMGEDGGHLIYLTTKKDRIDCAAPYS